MRHKTSYIHLSSLFFCLFFLPLFNMFVHFSLTTAHSSNNVYVGKQPVAWKEYFAEYFSKELMESMDRDTGHRDITEIMLKKMCSTPLNQFN